MMLTTRGRYAVMAMVDLAMQKSSRPIALSDIATRQNIALNYLEQIFSRLKKHGLVRSVRGPGGGYVLAKQIQDTSVVEVISAVDEAITITRCNKNKSEQGCMKDNARCLTHDLWEGLGDQISSYLQSISLADICNKSIKLGSGGGICFQLRYI